jgi:ParB family chromosome partitioning protein
MSEKKLMSLDDLFSFEEDVLETPEVVNISIDNLIPYSNHPFKLYEGERLNNMVDSIKELGVITPIIVQPGQNGLYEILAGHNRHNAARIAGLKKIPAIIKEGLTEEEAMLIVTETNLIQRSFEDLSYSERVAAISERYKAMKKQGKRNDLINEIKRLATEKIEKDITSHQLGTRLRTDKKLGQEYNLSRNMVARYVRLSQLNKSLLSRLDNGEIAFMTAVTLSFIRDDEQQIIEDILAKHSFKIDMKRAELLRKYSEEGNLTGEAVKVILSGEILNGVKDKNNNAIKLKPKFLKKYFEADVSKTEVEATIAKALDLYFNK